MRLDPNKVLSLADQEYEKLCNQENPIKFREHKARGEAVQIRSKQVKAAIRAIVKALNEEK